MGGDGRGLGHCGGKSIHFPVSSGKFAAHDLSF
jgi:hypothetical protein